MSPIDLQIAAVQIARRAGAVDHLGLGRRVVRTVWAARLESHRRRRRLGSHAAEDHQPKDHIPTDRPKVHLGRVHQDHIPRRMHRRTVEQVIATTHTKPAAVKHRAAHLVSAAARRCSPHTDLVVACLQAASARRYLSRKRFRCRRFRPNGVTSSVCRVQAQS